MLLGVNAFFGFENRGHRQTTVVVVVLVALSHYFLRRSCEIQFRNSRDVRVEKLAFETDCLCRAFLRLGCFARARARSVSCDTPLTSLTR